MANQSNSSGNPQAKKWKFNIVDTLVIVVLVLGILVLGFRGVLANLVADPEPEESEEPVYEPYVITYYYDTAYKFVTEHLEVGQRCTDDSVRLNMGALLDYELGPSVYWQANEAGQLVKTTRDDSNSVTLYLVCDARPNKDTGIITYDGLALSIGHTMVVRVGDTKIYLTVTGFEKFSESKYAGMELPEYGHVDPEEEEEANS